jgi:hypothetical protein
MKIKILLAGNNVCQKEFLKNLGKKINYTQAGRSIIMLGTGIYQFNLGKDVIEILSFEDYVEVLQKNYKVYAKGAKAIIFTHADAETIGKLTAVCPGIPAMDFTDEYNGNEFRVIKYIWHLCQPKVSTNACTVFSASQQPAAGQQTVVATTSKSAAAAAQQTSQAAKEVAVIGELNCVLNRRSGPKK